MAAACAAFSLIHPANAAEPTAPAKPNILFIITDDQGYGDWSTNGHPLLKSPHVDKLTAESVRLENFYVSASCSPTRGRPCSPGPDIGPACSLGFQLPVCVGEPSPAPCGGSCESLQKMPSMVR